MKLSIKIFGRYFTACIGRETPWFRQLDFFSVTEEFYEDNKICYAVSIISFWRKYGT